MVGQATRPGGVHKKFFLFLTEDVSPFIRNKKVKVTKMANNQFTVSLPYKPSFHSLPSTVAKPKNISSKEYYYHTGVLATLIDHAGGFGAWTFLEDPNLRISTANLRIDYLNDPSTPVTSDTLLFDADIFHIGQKIAKADITCWNLDRTQKIAVGRGSYNIYSIANRPNPLMEYLEYFPTFLYPLLPWITSYLFKQRIKEIQQRNKGTAINIVTTGSDTKSKNGTAANTQPEEEQSLSSEPSSSTAVDVDTSEVIEAVDRNSMTRYGGLSEVDFRKEVTDGCPYTREILRTEVDKLSHGKLSLKLPLKYDYVGNPALPALHGGVTAALIEHSSVYCARTTTTDASTSAWVSDSRIDYLRAAPCYGHMYCDAVVEHVSAKIVRVDSVCWDETRTHKVALGRVTVLLSTPTNSTNSATA